MTCRSHSGFGSSAHPRIRCASRAYSHTTPSPSPSRMNRYAGCPFGTGAMPCLRASAQAILPFPLSSHSAKASTSPSSTAERFVGRVTGTGGIPHSTTTISVAPHCESTASAASASSRSIVRPYLRRTSSVRATNQHALRSGVHSATSFALFWCRLTLGLASVRFSKSVANVALTFELAAHNPLSWASDAAGRRRPRPPCLKFPRY